MDATSERAARVRAILLTDDGRAALVSGSTGAVVRLVRTGLGWTQSELAAS